MEFFRSLWSRWKTPILSVATASLFPKLCRWSAEQWVGDKVANELDQIGPWIWGWMADNPLPSLIVCTSLLLAGLGLETKLYERSKRKISPSADHEDERNALPKEATQLPTQVSQSWCVEDEMGPDMAEAGLTFADVGISTEGMNKIFDLTAKVYPAPTPPPTLAKTLHDQFTDAGMMKDVPVEFRPHGRGILVSVKQSFDRDRAHKGTVSLEDIVKIDDVGSAKSRLFHEADGKFKYPGGLLGTAGLHGAASATFYHDEEHLWWLLEAPRGKPEIKWYWENRQGKTQEMPVGRWRIILRIEVGDRAFKRSVDVQVNADGAEIVAPV